MLAGAMRYLGFPGPLAGNRHAAETGRLGQQRERPARSQTRRRPAPTATATRRSGWEATTAGSASTPRPRARLQRLRPATAAPVPVALHERAAAAGHRKDKRIVFNVGSELFRPLYRDFEYDEQLAIDNNCGGDQRYNLQGRFDKPELWKSSRQRIYVQNLCFLKDISVSGEKSAKTLSWTAAGRWDLDPGSSLVVILQKMNDKTQAFEKAAVLMKGLPVKPNSIVLDLSKFSGANTACSFRRSGIRKREDIPRFLT